jgi:hypothetical protein
MKCSNCKRDKAVHLFYANTTAKAGRLVDYWCKACRKRRARYPGTRRRYRLASYGLSESDWQRISRNGCSICCKRSDLVVDHNHNTGKVRGALCRQCNAAIGLLQESQTLVEKAALYLSQ